MVTSSHTTKMAVTSVCYSQKPNATCKLHGYIQSWSFCQLEFYIVGIGIFDLCWACDLDLDPMTFIYEFTCIPSRYTGCAKMNLSVKAFESYHPRHTDTTEIIYHALRGWSVIITRCSAIAERPRCRVRYSFRQK